ncbi:MAG: MFS transporter [Lactobacillaceae bacterium]|jgi:EmrB/QacA subfamily drug resistance transporter|nr:MFS transporter [Lactobacillaceae bacterium]
MIEKKRPVSRKVVLAIIGTGLLAFTGILTETSMNVTFPDLMQQFGLPIGVVQWLTTGYLLTVSLVMTISAVLKAKFPPRTIYMIALISFLIGNVIAILSPNFQVLLVGRIIQGVGTGVITTLIFNIILENVPLSQIGRYMGIGVMILSLAPAFGPIFGGVVAYFFGWREIFWFILPILLISLVIAYKNIPNQHTVDREYVFDFLAFGLFSTAMIAIISALSVLEHGTFSPLLLGLSALAVVAFGAFVYRSGHTTKQFLNISILRNRATLFALLGYALFQMTNLAVNFTIPTYIQLVLGATTLAAGFALMPGSLLGALLNPYYGRMFDRIGARKPLLIGNTAFVIVMVLYAMFAQNLTVFLMTFFYALLTLGRNLAFGTSMTAGLAQLSQKERGDGNAIFNTSQQFTGAVGTTVAALFMHIDGHSSVSVARQTATGAQHVFLFLVGVGLINYLWFALFLKNEKKLDV